MLRYQLDFEINEGNINTFLIGSKILFEKIYYIEDLFANSIGVNINLEHKLVELENKKISYNIGLKTEDSLQKVFGENITDEQIEEWFSQGLKLIFDENSVDETFNNIIFLAKKLKLDHYFLYVEISSNILKKSLTELENLSILLFNKLAFFEI